MRFLLYEKNFRSTNLAKMGPCFLSALTIGEIHFGAEKLGGKDEIMQRHLRKWLEELIASFAGRILPIDTQVCFIWGDIMAQAAKRGIVLPLSDALIAVTALKHDLTVITQNLRHFQPTGVEILNPLDPA